MLVVLPFSRRDQALALANLQWISELGNVAAHDIVLFADRDVDCTNHLAVAESCFKSAKVAPVDKCTTDKWPISQNHVWKRIVDYVDYNQLYPFLLLESDAVFLVPTALNQIAREFLECGKPFSGYLEYAGDAQRRHMNGVAVYGDVYKHAPSLVTGATASDDPNPIAFDWAGGREVAGKMHVSKLFQFVYKKEDELLKDESLSWLNPEAVIFHTCKNVRLIDLLRARKNGVVLPLATHPEWQTAPYNAPIFTEDQLKMIHKPLSGGLTCDIFIKTYDKVADWHGYAMRSIEKFCTGFRKTVIVGQQPVEGYQQMQVQKLTADLRTDADYILFTDSDCIFSTPVTPQTYMRDGRSIWLHRNWTAELERDAGLMKWRRGMAKFFGIEPPFEFMCRHPEMIPRWLLVAFRMFCQQRHGMTMEAWVLKDKEFADWNILGMYAWLYHRECFHWINQDDETPPPMTVEQYWGGHTQIGPHIPEMEAILSGLTPNPAYKSASHEIRGSALVERTSKERGIEKPKRQKRRVKPKHYKNKGRTPEAQARINARMAKVRAGKFARA